jgi:hypothetical protein
MEYCLDGGDGTASMWTGQSDIDLDGDDVFDGVRLDFDGDGVFDDAIADADGDGVGDYAALDLEDVALSVSYGNIVEVVPGAFGKGVAGQAYRFIPAGGPTVEENLVLEKEDYTDTKRWELITPTRALTGNETTLTVAAGNTVRTSDGRWYQRMGDGISFDPRIATYADTEGWREMDVMSSDKGKAFAMALSDDFYIVKPKDVALPKLVYGNVANQLFEDRAKVLGWMESHAGNAEAIARYQALLNTINDQMSKLGLSEADAATGAVSARDSFDVLTLRMPAILASAGLISIKADTASQAAIQTAIEAMAAAAPAPIVRADPGVLLDTLAALGLL